MTGVQFLYLGPIMFEKLGHSLYPYLFFSLEMF